MCFVLSSITKKYKQNILVGAFQRFPLELIFETLKNFVALRQFRIVWWFIVLCASVLNHFGYFVFLTHRCAIIAMNVLLLSRTITHIWSNRYLFKRYYRLSVINYHNSVTSLSGIVSHNEHTDANQALILCKMTFDFIQKKILMCTKMINDFRWWFLCLCKCLRRVHWFKGIKQCANSTMRSWFMLIYCEPFFYAS